MEIKKLIIQLSCTVLLLCAAKYQAYRFDNQQKGIKHWLWGLYYAILLIPVYLFTHDFALLGVCIIQRIPVFNTSLNFFRTPRRPIFYINLDGQSWWDRLYGPIYRYVYFTCSILLIVLNFFVKW